MNKAKNNKCKNCGEPCCNGSFVCGLCFVKVFGNNRNNKYEDWRHGYMKKYRLDENHEKEVKT